MTMCMLHRRILFLSFFARRTPSHAFASSLDRARLCDQRPATRCCDISRARALPTGSQASDPTTAPLHACTNNDLHKDTSVYIRCIRTSVHIYMMYMYSYIDTCIHLYIHASCPSLPCVKIYIHVCAQHLSSLVPQQMLFCTRHGATAPKLLQRTCGKYLCSSSIGPPRHCSAFDT